MKESQARPNLLFLMADQMQARVLEHDHPCITQNLDRLAAQGVRFTRAYTPNAICSPARASLMTGLLPHNHGVLWVTHTVDRDQGMLREDKPHWAQYLREAGYRTGYFGKWHVEHTESPGRFGWDFDASLFSEAFKREERPLLDEKDFTMSRYYDAHSGYRRSLHYGVTTVPPEHRRMGTITRMAEGFLSDMLRNPEPWCCFVSVPEPHDPFVAGEEAFGMYDADSMPVPQNWNDELAGRPGIYRKVARLWQDMTEAQKKTAAACYFASITEIDALFGRLIRMIEEAGKFDETIVVFTSDHGELLGAHGLYCKNFTAAEEIYNVPLIVSGPGVSGASVCGGRR